MRLTEHAVRTAGALAIGARGCRCGNCHGSGTLGRNGGLSPV